MTLDGTTLSPGSSSSQLTAINLHLLKSLWLPDVEILNLKTFETLTVLSKLEGIWIDHELNLVSCSNLHLVSICQDFDIITPNSGKTKEKESFKESFKTSEAKKKSLPSDLPN